MWHQERDYSRKKCVKKSQRKRTGLGTAVQSFIVFSTWIFLKPKWDHLLLISHHRERKCEQAQSRIQKRLASRKLFYGVSFVAITSFREFSQKCSCTWHTNKWQSAKQWAPTGGRCHVWGRCRIWGRAERTRRVAKSAFPIAIFPIWKRGFSDRQGPPRRATSTKRSLGRCLPTRALPWESQEPPWPVAGTSACSGLVVWSGSTGLGRQKGVCPSFVDAEEG